MNKKAVILCNGEFPHKANLLSLIKEADILICCDGALSKLDSSFGKELPNFNACVGDLDSLPDDLKLKYKNKLIYITEQESNDMTKAFYYLLKNFEDVSTVYFLAATGLREDHSLANMGLLMFFDEIKKTYNKDLSLYILSDYTTIFPISDSCSLNIGKDKTISIISPDNSLNIVSQGLKWQTSKVVFNNWFPATLNLSIEDTIRLTFNHPSKALIIVS